jgi:hypothetical protein
MATAQKAKRGRANHLGPTVHSWTMMASTVPNVRGAPPDVMACQQAARPRFPRPDRKGGVSPRLHGRHEAFRIS